MKSFPIVEYLINDTATHDRIHRHYAVINKFAMSCCASNFDRHLAPNAGSNMHLGLKNDVKQMTA